jgi:hypothetical protein
MGSARGALLFSGWSSSLLLIICIGLSVIVGPCRSQVKVQVGQRWRAVEKIERRSKGHGDRGVSAQAFVCEKVYTIVGMRQDKARVVVESRWSGPIRFRAYNPYDFERKGGEFVTVVEAVQSGVGFLPFILRGVDGRVQVMPQTLGSVIAQLSEGSLRAVSGQHAQYKWSAKLSGSESHVAGDLSVWRTGLGRIRKVGSGKFVLKFQQEERAVNEWSSDWSLDSGLGQREREIRHGDTEKLRDLSLPEVKRVLRAARLWQQAEALLERGRLKDAVSLVEKGLPEAQGMELLIIRALARRRKQIARWQGYRETMGGKLGNSLRGDSDEDCVVVLAIWKGDRASSGVALEELWKGTEELKSLNCRIVLMAFNFESDAVRARKFKAEMKRLGVDDLFYLQSADAGEDFPLHHAPLWIVMDGQSNVQWVDAFGSFLSVIGAVKSIKRGKD